MAGVLSVSSLPLISYFISDGSKLEIRLRHGSTAPFPVRQICKITGHRRDNAVNTIRSHNPAWIELVKNYPDETGVPQDTNFTNEEGLFLLAQTGRTVTCQRFRCWLSHVCACLSRTGSYTMPADMLEQERRVHGELDAALAEAREAKAQKAQLATENGHLKAANSGLQETVAHKQNEVADLKETVAHKQKEVDSTKERARDAEAKVPISTSLFAA